MGNFDYLKEEKRFDTFSNVAIAAEKVLYIDPGLCVMNCRRAMEFAIKWMYSVDASLTKPYQENLISLMNTEEFKDIIDEDLFKRMDFIRKIGNEGTHNARKITEEQAILCLENLHIFFDFVSYCYADNYTEQRFDRSLMTKEVELPKTPEISNIDLDKLMAENASLRASLTEQREEKIQSYVTKPLELSEYSTRKIYIDAMLLDAGWREGSDWLNEVKLKGLPTKSGEGFADYVLYDSVNRPIAVVEAKRTCVDVVAGRKQASDYADAIEKETGRRPCIFLTNGFETKIIDGKYPERKVASVYSKEDLEKMFNLRKMRTSLENVVIDKNIAGRYYQEAAIKAVCNAFDRKNRRKALLVMATGSGKTRTVIELCHVLLDAGWIKNILFLADRITLVRQAKRAFQTNYPNLSLTNLCEDKENYNAHCVFSTYQTMMNCIDSVKDEDRKLFTCGHFDLVVCDEAHRSIYNKYKNIFTYFDAPLVGLTATPKDDIDKNTYERFDLEQGVPTYGYELAEAVKDGYLVDFLSVETKLKFIEDGIVYADLSDEDKAIYENTFEMEDGSLPEAINSSALNDWIFNTDTIRQALDTFMENGIKIDYGQKIGKSIIFAKNHAHAEKILKIFNKEYPHLIDHAQVIDNRIKNALNIIDEFSDANKLPQIAISVDMLDTGIDVPEVVNLVFFKKVMSYAKFWQMIGRGTRLCPGLIDGVDKSKFYIFDFCGNFDFFRINKGKAAANDTSIQSAIFSLKFEIAYRLQDMDYQTEELIAFRKRLVEEMVGKVVELPRDNFAIRQHLKYVEMYSSEEGYKALTFEDTVLIREELAPLILPEDDEISAVRFDALMYGIELACLAGKSYKRFVTDLKRNVKKLANIANITEINEQSDLIGDILHTDYIVDCGVNEFERIREKLRDLMKYIPKGGVIYETNFTDDIISIEWNDSDLESDSLKNYRAKAEYYIREHQDNEAIKKLKSNIPLSKEDIKELENVLWSELGTKEEYEHEYGQKPLGELVREIVGLDMNAAKEAFSEYLENSNLDNRQIYFVNQIVEYIVHNGMMKDLSVLQDAPFTDQGSIVEIFTDISVWMDIKSIIDNINENAAA
ncbi:type III restriction enzyme, res subunit [Lachnoanaerobaculum sp. ICM7]|uniref:DEAD/DEAH box helicase family protein n=1 Tax=Lachnoanaerobaculum sp. ICM7 TaxID=936594 RepID=UPI00027A3E58|nr:DEAD/DEAH box helicase family protein [Lachnoanaerobaculum sp. ICM7]EJP19760.1 type III restriction enzyme, res subunit [Lachnoanaerobaculum sp. ICM7]